MFLELNLYFPDPQHVIVSLIDDNSREETKLLTFTSPVSDKGHQHLRWYLEEYATQYSADLDHETAQQIVKQLSVLGKALFDKVFSKRAARNLFKKFRGNKEPYRVLTITADHPSILSLPWELLHYSGKGGDFLINENPRISIRRRIHTPKTFAITPQWKLHILFVVSRPTNASFTDPRAIADEALNAIDSTAAAGRVTVEFLRPATLQNLRNRLESKTEPRVNILHFDGHSVFDSEGQLEIEAKDGFKTMSVNFRTKLAELPMGKDTNYLLFEKDNGEKQLVPVSLLANMFNRQQIALVILSIPTQSLLSPPNVNGVAAPQNVNGVAFPQNVNGIAAPPNVNGIAFSKNVNSVAAPPNINGVAASQNVNGVAALMATIGAPFVLLISSSMLKPAARKLFEGFYDSLAQGYGIGVALDNARLALLENTERREIHRFKERLTIHVHDWFTPVLYQPGADAALLTQPQNAQPVPRQEIITGSNLTTISEAGFFGRWRELWQIEHWFVRGVRCVSINSFGGEGKTYLAREVGRWLHRTGFFKRVVFVDYANFQGTDAVSAVVSMIAAVSHKNLLDSEAATDALRRVPTLLILDNLETLEKNSPHSLPNLKIPPLEDWGAALQTSTTNGSSLKQLLDMAQKWSETGQSRVLFTTRQPSLPHAAFPSQGGLRYCQLSLPRLDENEALRYFDALMNLPPEPAYGMPPREAVEQMFKRIDYHPFSINLLARQLKYDSVKNLDVRLERALRGLPANMPQAEKSLVVSLNLVLETLEPMVLQLISKLGVFQGGAFENALQAITEISEAQWQQLRQILEATALIQPEYLNGVAAPYLKFHPSLAPILWGRLSTAEQQALIERHRLGYYELSNFLYAEEKDNPTQTGAIERKELPNLLCAVRGAVKTNKQWAAPFADNVKSFLVDFGLKSDIEQLTTETAAVTTPPLVTPPQPELATLSEQGKEFYNAKRYQDAQAVFERILERLGNIASYEHAIALGWLGRCLAELNQLNLAADYFQQALSELRLLESSPIIRQEIGWLQIYLATVLKEIEDYAGAKEAYEVALPIMQETRNTHNEAVIQSQLGTLAMLQGNLIEAEQRLSLALPLFQQLKKPLSEADAWHSLGEIHQQVKNLQAAAQAYQQAAQIREQQGELAAAAKSWYQFAQVNQTLGNLSQAETGYGKAIEFAKTNKDWIGIANGLYSLADLLHNQPLRLDEARQFAETGLSVSKTLDPNVATIWKTYSLLAKIAELQNDALQAHNYRCLARETKANSAQAQNELQQHQQFIDAVVAAVAKPALQSQLESMLQKREAKGWTQLTAAIRRVLAGDRDWNMLCDAERLDLLDSVILQKILQRVSNQ